MIPKDISLSDIRTFVVLAEAGSFTKAAEQLGCGRPQISKQLAQLEDSLGLSLLIRTTRSQQLTEQGQLFYQQCQQALLDIEQVIEKLQDSRDKLHGHLHINSVGGPIGEDIIAPMVNQFLGQHPEIKIELDFSSPRVDLIQEQYDFVFRMGELEDSSLIARKLCDLNISLYCSPSYAQQYGQPQTPDELSQHRCITGSVQQWSFKNPASNKTEGFNIDGQLQCKNGRVMLTSAIAGNGIIRVPELYCQKEVKEGKLIPLLQDWRLVATPLYLIYVKQKNSAARIQAFKDFVIESFEEFRP
ncbi:LysR family transcriptional regulator [uncultured Pseudoteredinibacter sp.]|uniref:LysR family transcriptional regulator n=1 Tax=uncultured Pseudoteredinibacter sp. TaxID=1641701 RepID=UPI00261465A7|nr:LysR family transcriptional regulator [uncultured Pseudoteredinibacter sp.]